MQCYLELSNVGIEFNTNNVPFKALSNVNLKVNKGDFVSLIGHSGCGKSTILNIIAGLHQATEGGVILEGRQVDSPNPDRAVVFQNHALLPWLTVYENVELAVKQVFKGRRPASEVKGWVEHNLDLVSMTHAKDKLPHEISGGMKQRVGIARAVVNKPPMILADEPTGNLDPALSAEIMQLFEQFNQVGVTVLIASHDLALISRMGYRQLTLANGEMVTSNG